MFANLSFYVFLKCSAIIEQNPREWILHVRILYLIPEQHKTHSSSSKLWRYLRILFFYLFWITYPVLPVAVLNTSKCHPKRHWNYTVWHLLVWCSSYVSQKLGIASGVVRKGWVCQSSKFNKHPRLKWKSHVLVCELLPIFPTYRFLFKRYSSCQRHLTQFPQWHRIFLS